MTALTTRQRDLLQLLLAAHAPLAAAEMAEQMHLTPRQVSYGLKGLKRWLAQKEITLDVTPGVGVTLACSPEQEATLQRELSGANHFQLILAPEQRQQLLALLLLDVGKPVILQQLQQFVDVSRTTVLSDLDALEPWLAQHDLHLERRPNYGIEISGTEMKRRQGQAAWAWGETPFGPALVELIHGEGAIFTLEEDAALLPIVGKVNEIIESWQMERVFSQVAYAETQLGGRFSDDAVLYLTLLFAIQTARLDAGHVVHVAAADAAWLQGRPVWPVATAIASRLRWGVGKPWPDDEIAAIAMHLLAATRNERWPGDLDVDAHFTTMMDQLMHYIAARYELPTLEQDKTLQDGIVVHAVPAYLRQRFALHMPPPPPTTTLSEKYTFEHQLARDIAQQFEESLGTFLPEGEVNNIALLLRAAYIRERPYRLREVIVVCPSGMATAQLLLARLKARFPRLGEPKVLSLRELDEARVQAADLVVITAALPRSLATYDNVIRVHPLLLPEDVEAITKWLSSR
jgi:mannitol operon transcriptional antiterminator